MSNRRAAVLTTAGAAVLLILPSAASAQDGGAAVPPARAAGAHPSIIAASSSEAQKARLASDMARLDSVCAPLQMARDPLVTALQTMLQQREESLKMQRQHLGKLRADAVKAQNDLGARGGDSADYKQRLADIDGALATFTRERTSMRKDYQALIGALNAEKPPAATDSAKARRSLAGALGGLAARISSRIGAGTYRRIMRSAEARALSCYNTHLKDIGLVAADGKQCRAQNLSALGPQLLDSSCSYHPQGR